MNGITGLIVTGIAAAFAASLQFLLRSPTYFERLIWPVWQVLIGAAVVVGAYAAGQAHLLGDWEYFTALACCLGIAGVLLLTMCELAPEVRRIRRKSQIEDAEADGENDR